jgi:outer membrane protein assembly factor BamB
MRLSRHIRRMVTYLWPVAVGVLLGYELVTIPAASPPPSTDVGARTWTKYGWDGADNPVLSGPGMSGWTADWTVTAPEPLQQLSVVDGVVYAVGDGNGPGDGNLYAYDAGTGALRWETHLNNVSMTTPLVARGLVFVGTGNQFFRPRAYRRDQILAATHIVRGVGPNAVYAVDALDGHVVWQFATPGEDMATFVYRHGTLYVAGGNGRVYALDARTGRLRWSVNIGSYVSMSSPAIAGSLLLVSGAHPYTLYAVTTTPPHRVWWARPLPGVFAGSDDSSIAVSQGRIFLEGTTGNGRRSWTHVFAYSTAGRLLWNTRIGEGPLPRNIEVGSPVVVGDRVFAGSPLDNTEAALSAATGRVLWRFRALNPVASSVVVDHGVVYVADEGGVVYALRAATGRMLMARPLGGRFAADDPVVVGNTLLLANENGQLDALPLSLWNPTLAYGGPELPWPANAPLAAEIGRGEALFVGTTLSARGLSCSSCHFGAGTLPGFSRGRAIPPLVGVASLFPMERRGGAMTLDGQIGHCLAGMGGPVLAADDPRMVALNVYLHWLASGFPSQIMREPANNSGHGGC